MPVYDPKVLDRLCEDFWAALMAYLEKVEALRRWCAEHERSW
jgi:hypothetical protein